MNVTIQWLVTGMLVLGTRVIFNYLSIGCILVTPAERIDGEYKEGLNPSYHPARYIVNSHLAYILPTTRHRKTPANNNNSSSHRMSPSQTNQLNSHSNKGDPTSPGKKHSLADKIKDEMNPPSRSNTSSSGESEVKSVRSSSSSVRSQSPPRKTTSTKNKTNPKPRAQSHTFSDVGRHSNQWLFNNMSITSAVKTLFEK